MLSFNHLLQIFEHWGHQSPHQEALVAPNRLALTYGTLLQQLTDVGNTLQRFGLAHSSRVAILAPNGPELALAFLASASYTTSAPLNPAYQKNELEFYLDDLEASSLLVASTLNTPARDVAQARGIPILEMISQPEQPAGCFSIEGETGRAPVSSSSSFSRQSEDVALVLHTSGTTARPKQVPLTQENLCASVRHIQRGLALSPQDCCLNLMPLFHIHGLIGALLSSLSSGGSVVCPPTFSSTQVFSWMRDFHPTWYTAVPTIHQAILAQAELDQEESHVDSLRFIRSSSASLAPSVMQDLENLFGVPVIEAYGMTEATHQMASNPLPPLIRKAGSVGVAAGPEIQIVSEAGDTLPIGEIGEVVIRGPNVMSGYSQNPSANTQSFINGWFRTGDQGYLDTEGYLFLTGRLKEQINRGGEKIAPLEIDQVLLQHPHLRQTVTFAIPHPTLGEEVAAAVVLKPGVELTEKELRRWMATRLAQFKIPKKIFFVEDIPKGPTGKIQRLNLAKQLMGSPDSPPEYLSGKLEDFLLTLFQQHLKLNEINKDDSFFMLGGDSILATQIANRLRGLSDSLPLDAVTIFENPTVEELHQYLMDNVDAKTLVEFCKSI